MCLCRRHQVNHHEESIEAQIAGWPLSWARRMPLQVIAGLKALADAAGGQLPATGLALLGKAQILLGQPADGLQSLKRPWRRRPMTRICRSTPVPRLATGDVQGALALLRGVAAGSGGAATASRRCCATSRPGPKPATWPVRCSWLEVVQPIPRRYRCNVGCLGRRGLEDSDKASPVRQAALALLTALQQAVPEERSEVRVLADALEIRAITAKRHCSTASCCARRADRR